MRAPFLLVSLGLSAALVAQGQVLLTTEEALALAFPDCAVERTMQTLDDAQRSRVKELCGEELDRALVYPYEAKRDGSRIGTAYFDAHRVRTLRETLMVVVRDDGTLDRVELLAFGEPKEYAPRDVFYAQFPGRALDEELNLKRSIRGITGATLSARATVDCARRILAIHRVLEEARAAAAREERERKERQQKEQEAQQPRPADDPAPGREPPAPDSEKPAPGGPAPRPAPEPEPTPRDEPK